MNRVWIPVVLGWTTLYGLSAAAQDKTFKGAAELIREVTARVEASRQKTDETKNSKEAFREAVKAYQEGMDALPPESAAEQWLKLSDMFLELRPVQNEREYSWRYPSDPHRRPLCRSGKGLAPAKRVAAYPRGAGPAAGREEPAPAHVPANLDGVPCE